MNAYDAERMADLMAEQGYQETDSPEHADVVIINTCHIREKAAEKIYSELGRLRRIKTQRAQSGEETRIVVAGCVAQAEGDEILRRTPAVDVVVGPQNYHHLPDLLARSALKPVVDTDFATEDKFDHLPHPTPQTIITRGVSAFLTIQEGCDKFCSFCVVPYTRGIQVSRPIARILEEAEQLINAGIREITLIGQNVNAFDGEDASGNKRSLGYLMQYLADSLPGLKRIRYTTSHPRDMDDELVSAHRNLPQLMPYLHLPVQSGSDRILHAMNRQHSADDFRRWIEKIRHARPDIALSSDFIVGFPGETDEEFRETLKLVEETFFASSFSFKYSPRPGTPAAERQDQIDDDIKNERLYELQALLEQQRQSFNRETIGRIVDVLFEKPGRHPGQIIGKTPYLQAAHMNTEQYGIGDIVPVRVASTLSNSLLVEAVQNAH